MRKALVPIALLLVVAPLSAQTSAQPTPEQLQAAYELHKGDFDYLLGDWEFKAVSKEYGPYGGYWSAVRLDGEQILDEFRVVGDSGETYYLTTTIRAYNAVRDQWELIGMDASKGLHDFGTARRVAAEMHIEQRFGVMSDSPSLWRIRYFDIQPERFSWSADRSLDDGKTWEKEYLTIEAHRIGPAHPLGPLAKARKSS